MRLSFCYTENNGTGAAVIDQPYAYQRRELTEPDWRRFPGWAEVTSAQWESAQWQRSHCVKNLRQLRAVAGPVRRYMIPVFSDRRADWPSHPYAARDSLHEAEMWAVEGLTHRYPTKVLAELLSTCPQYCGHCTRMDLVGNDVPQVTKLRFQIHPKDRYEQILDYLRKTPSVRDVVVSGGDIANLPIGQLESFVSELMDIENIRDIRLASKALMGIPQHFLLDGVLSAFDRLAKKARERSVDLALHTHVNHPNQVTPLVAKAAKKL